MSTIPSPAQLPYPDFTGLSKEEKIDALAGWVSASAPQQMVTLSEPVVFIHENGQTSILG